jgi:hypothetical protein
MNPTVIRYVSARYWGNGQQRRLYGHQEADPYNPSVTVSHGQFRKLLIDGYNRAFHSGTGSRVNILCNSYNAEIYFETVWKSSDIDHLSLWLRSRVDEEGDTEDKFGGYVVDIYDDSVEWYKQDTLDSFTALSPASTSISPTLSDGERLRIKFYAYSINNNTETELRLEIGRPYALANIGTSNDSSPASHVLDQKLYRNYSFAHIVLNGGNAKDVMYENLRIWDLGDTFLWIEKELQVVKQTQLLSTIMEETETQTEVLFDID